MRGHTRSQQRGATSLINHSVRTRLAWRTDWAPLLKRHTSTLYPLVTMDLSAPAANQHRVREDARARSDEHLRPHPRLSHRGISRVVAAEFRYAVLPAWLDVSREPMVISARPTPGADITPAADAGHVDRRLRGAGQTHYRNFARSLGDRRPQAGLGSFRGTWGGSTPRRSYVWMIGRTQTNRPQDYAAVKEIQDGFVATPLSQWGRERHPANGAIDPTVDTVTPPLEQVNKMPPLQFFSYAAEAAEDQPAPFYRPADRGPHETPPG